MTERVEAPFTELRQIGLRLACRRGSRLSEPLPNWQLSGELAGLGRDDREGLFDFRLVGAAPAISQTRERHRLAIGAREVRRVADSDGSKLNYRAKWRF
jgi:hypothetical protein